MFARQSLPTLADAAACRADALPGFFHLHDLERLQARRRPDALCPEGTADERTLGSLHDFAPADCCGDGVAVAECLAKHRHVGFDAIELMEATESLAKPRGAFVE